MTVNCQGLTENSEIVAAYRARTPGSAALAARARQALPSGLTHDSRYLLPYGVYIERARGARKWDVDGNEYVDYFGGHGSLLLGHGHPAVVAATERALAQGTHFGANHPLEVRWAERVQEMVPTAERVRFTVSGTESTHLALRLARAFTGKHKIVRVKTHFHGWHDLTTSGSSSHFNGSPATGVLENVAESSLLVPPEDVAALDRTLAQDQDVAALLLEPTGASFGRVPISPRFLHAARDLSARHGVLLIFDEVITGFRVAPGGAQQHYGIRPDLTTLAKILAGGLPGGAVAGRRDILDLLDFEATRRRGVERISHMGTYNANPLSAAAGVATLEAVGDGAPCRQASAFAAQLRRRLNLELESAGVPWAAYGEFSAVHLFTNPRAEAVTPTTFDPFAQNYSTLKATAPRLLHKLQLALLVNGVYFNRWPGGVTSAAHDAQDLERTVAGFRRALAMLAEEGEIGSQAV